MTDDDLPASLYEAMQKYQEGEFAAWISKLLYNFSDQIGETTAGLYGGKLVVPSMLSRMRAYFEKVAIEKLFKEAKENYQWVIDLSLKGMEETNHGK